MPGLVAAASLLTDYVLTVAVSISAGVLAIFSLAPQLASLPRADLPGCAVAIILLLNLRGMREAGNDLRRPDLCLPGLDVRHARPWPLPVFTGRLAQSAPCATSPAGRARRPLAAVGLLLLLAAFSSGCTALTGIEAISDGVPAFEKPEARNAAQTMMALGVLLGSCSWASRSWPTSGRPPVHDRERAFAGRAHRLRARWTASASAARTCSGSSQWATALILVLAANTSFADFPRLSFFLARDRFLPHQFAFRGDRLAFSIGIMTWPPLAGAADRGLRRRYRRRCCRCTPSACSARSRSRRPAWWCAGGGCARPAGAQRRCQRHRRGDHVRGAADPLLDQVCRGAAAVHPGGCHGQCRRVDRAGAGADPGAGCFCASTGTTRGWARR